MEILIEAKDRGLDLRINIDCCFTMNCPQSTGDQKEPPKEKNRKNIITEKKDIFKQEKFDLQSFPWSI